MPRRPFQLALQVMLHCHRLDHEDEGMMAMELVKASGPCACGDLPLEGYVVALIVAGSCLLTCCLVLLLVLVVRRARHGTWCGRRPNVSPV